MAHGHINLSFFSAIINATAMQVQSLHNEIVTAELRLINLSDRSQVTAELNEVSV